MDFSIEPKLQDTLATIRTFMREEIYPLEREFLSKPFTDLLPALNEKRSKVKQMGLWSPSIPKEYGGAGFSFLEFAHISEERT
jgi:acyl-CoA dehydrogenase